MNLNVVASVVVRLLGVLPMFVSTVNKIKDAKGADKKQAVIESIDDFMEMAEIGIGKDVLNNANVLALRDALIEAEVAVMKARNAYKAGLLNKAEVVTE